MAIFFHAFPNAYGGEGQPAFIGYDKNNTHKIALWWAKDKNGRAYLVVKVEDLVPGTRAQDLPDWDFDLGAP